MLLELITKTASTRPAKARTNGAHPAPPVEVATGSWSIRVPAVTGAGSAAPRETPLSTYAGSVE